MKKYITYIFVSFFIIPIHSQEDLWDVIRENSNFQYSADRSEIQKALKIYKSYLAHEKKNSLKIWADLIKKA